MSSRKENLNKKNSKDSNLFTDFNIFIEKSKKCNLKNTIGLITPKDVDNFSYISNDNSKTEPKIKKVFCELTPDKNIIRINIVPRTNKNELKALNLFESFNSISDKENKEPNIPQFKAVVDYYREIDQDSKESIIPCKPMLNSTSSKAFMKEYSYSKKYQEDKINFFSTTETSIDEQFPLPRSNKIFFPSTESQSPILEDLDENRYDMEIEELLKYQESNLPVPIKKKDDESFKLLTMKKMKRKTMPPNKSVRKFAEDIEPVYEKEFRIQNNFCQLLKRKVVHSTRRLYSSNFVLKKGKNNFNFMIFRDKDIGIYEYWQAHIHEAQNDEDFDTDEEQKKLAKCFTLGEIKEALVYVRDNSFQDCFVNFNRYNNYRTKDNNNYIKEKISELQENMKL